MLTVRRTFHDELMTLQQQVVKMGAFTNGMISDAVESLERGDVALAEQVIRRDDVVDAMDLEIESHCMNLLALQQPMARDLRQIATTLKVITDLERIGDHAVDIAKIARKLTQQLLVNKPLIDIAPLSEMAQRMVSQSLEALVRHDVGLAIKTCADDDLVDEQFKLLRDELLDKTQTTPSAILPASYMLLAVVYLERVADHATNIAERVNYVETGHLEQLARSHRVSENSIEAA